MQLFTRHLKRINPEHVMLLFLLGLGLVFLTVPILEGYSDDARIFPQMTASVVVIGSVLLLIREYLPEPLQLFVSESVSVMQDFEEEEVDKVEEITGEEVEQEEPEDDAEKDPPLHVEWGYDINNTVIMMVFSVSYFLLGYAVGFLYVTPLFVFGYTYWFRVPWYYCLVLAVLATAIIYGFVEFLLMPFDRGQIVFTQGLI